MELSGTAKYPCSPMSPHTLLPSLLSTLPGATEPLFQSMTLLCSENFLCFTATNSQLSSVAGVVDGWDTLSE